MDTPNTPLKPPSTWKRLAIISLFCGAGFALMAGLIFGGFVWYSSRPTPLKPWVSTIIVAKGSPAFSVSDDGKMLELDYALENTGNSDYHIDSLGEVESMARGKDGTLSGLLPDRDERLRLPFFIPMKRKAMFELSLVLPDLPARGATESDADFHEHLRRYLQGKYETLGEFTVFDSTNRYEIDLPKWLGEAPKEQTH
jgi:hypothetical protein